MLSEVGNGGTPLARQVGRPTKFTEAIVDQLCAALADGCPIRGACTVAGIGVTTLSEWREKHPEINQRIDEARELARQKALQAIKAAGEKDWRANAEWLRLTFPADYRGNANKIEVSATAQASAGLVITEEQKCEIQEARRKALQRMRAVE
jgi:hypothetical protein